MNDLILSCSLPLGEISASPHTSCDPWHSFNSLLQCYSNPSWTAGAEYSSQPPGSVAMVTQYHNGVNQVLSVSIYKPVIVLHTRILNFIKSGPRVACFSNWISVAPAKSNNLSMVPTSSLSHCYAHAFSVCSQLVLVLSMCGAERPPSRL